MARVIKTVSYSYAEGFKFPYSIEVRCVDSEGILLDISKKCATYEEFQEAIEGVVNLFPLTDEVALHITKVTNQC